jgi:hypothetical protein
LLRHIAPALGLRAGMDVLLIVPQTTQKEMTHVVENILATQYHGPPAID